MSLTQGSRCRRGGSSARGCLTCGPSACGRLRPAAHGGPGLLAAVPRAAGVTGARTFAVLQVPHFDGTRRRPGHDKLFVAVELHRFHAARHPGQVLRGREDESQVRPRGRRPPGLTHPKAGGLADGPHRHFAVIAARRQHGSRLAPDGEAIHGARMGHELVCSGAGGRQYAVSGAKIRPRRDTNGRSTAARLPVAAMMCKNLTVAPAVTKMPAIANFYTYRTALLLYFT